MPLYTFFLEYGGGTYVSQVEASDEMEAPQKWASNFDLHITPDYEKLFERDFRKKLIESLDLNLVAELQDLINTWAWSAYRLEKPATIHFTKTVAIEL